MEPGSLLDVRGTMVFLWIGSGCVVVPPLVVVSPSPPPPRIGITGSTSLIEEAVRRAGGVPVPLPAHDGPDGCLGDLDGLILGPGDDVNPNRYGQPSHPTIVGLDPLRESHDFTLARQAIEQDLPVLGVCLGAQVLVVAAGGSLIQDVPSQVPGAIPHRALHEVRWTPDTPLGDLYGVPVSVVSNHHQAADRLPPGLTVAGRSTDGVIEAFYAPQSTWLWGVQFHPEGTEGHDALWTALVDAASAGESRPRPWPLPATRALPTCAWVRTPFDEPDRESKASLEARLSARFGDHRSSYVRGHKHGGIDLTTTPGEPVLAICPGEVVDIHLAFPHTTVVVEHRMADDARRYSAYKHVTDLAVGIGDRVHEQTRIGRVFDAEEQRRAPWRANHLHLEIRTDISDGGRASWTSMDLAQLGLYAIDPAVFFVEHLR